MLVIKNKHKKQLDEIKEMLSQEKTQFITELEHSVLDMIKQRELYVRTQEKKQHLKEIDEIVKIERDIRIKLKEEAWTTQ